MYSLWVGDSSEYIKAQGVNKIAVATIVIMNTEKLCWIINVSDIRWIEVTVKTKEQEASKWTKFLYHS